jgi:hypothetical protein
MIILERVTKKGYEMSFEIGLLGWADEYKRLLFKRFLGG